MKNCPRVECRRVSISMGAIYKAAYGTLSRRAMCAQSTGYWGEECCILDVRRLPSIDDRKKARTKTDITGETLECVFS